MTRMYGVAITIAVVGVAASTWLNPSAAAQSAPSAKSTIVLASAAPSPVTHSSLKYQWSPSLRLNPTNGLLGANGGWKSIKVKSGDTLSELFTRAGLPASDWIALLKLKGKVSTLRSLHPGDVLRYQKASDGHLAALEYALGPLTTLHIERANQQFSYSIKQKPKTVRVVRAAGPIRNSLLSAVEREGVDPTTAANFANILQWRIDLSHSIHTGDHFVLIYRQVYADHHRVKTGPVLAARLTTDGHTITAFRYTDKQGHTAYYDKNGNSLRPSILRTPVHYTRVSSHFSLNRLNPVLHVRRPHYGVDLAAPKGTPIRAAANGYVKLIGRDGGYGRLIILNNFGPYSTRYGHMSRFAKGLKKGDFVQQGQVIGYVGESGVATGPHLHFEIRINGVPKPPLKVDLPDGAPIPSNRKAAYRKTITPFLTALKSAPESGQTLLARRQIPEPNAAGKLTVASIRSAMESRIKSPDADASVDDINR